MALQFGRRNICKINIKLCENNRTTLVMCKKQLALSKGYRAGGTWRNGEIGRRSGRDTRNFNNFMLYRVY